MKHAVKKIVIIILSYIGLVIFIAGILSLTIAKDQNVYNNLAVSIIVSWMLTLVVYYIWAIYYYNFNYGLEDKQWERIDELRSTDPVKAKQVEPQGNPFADQTLGLPPGTIRGTLALSLMVAGLAMIIASLSMKSTLAENEFFIDNFEFFKTAFLMMIAFYFGNKSLDILKQRKIIYGAPERQNSQKLPFGQPPDSPGNTEIDDTKKVLQEADDE